MQIKTHTAAARTNARTSLIALALGTLMASIASAAPTAWTTPSGTQSTFTYTNGQSLNGNFGTGNATGTGFFTSPAGLIAQASGGMDGAGNTGTASDTLSVILNAKPAQQFGSISTTILGDFVTSGFAFAGATGQLRVFNLNNLAAGPQVMDLDFGNSFGGSSSDSLMLFAPPFGKTQGGFEGTAALALPDNWTNIRVELDGMVTADAIFGDSSSTIQAKDVSLDVTTAPRSNTTEVPLPAAVFAAPIAAGIALKYRRKLVRA